MLQTQIHLLPYTYTAKNVTISEEIVMIVNYQGRTNRTGWNGGKHEPSWRLQGSYSKPLDTASSSQVAQPSY